MNQMLRLKNRMFPRRGISTENLTTMRDLQTDSTPSLIKSVDSRPDSEIISMRVHHLLEKKKYQKVIELLREHPHTHILACLESFPFKLLNKSIPQSFSIWETLLTKVHGNEEGYIPQFPYAACDELVIRIAHLLAYLERENCQQDDQLFMQCRRLLKKVYLHYHDIVNNLMKENERLSKALYSMTLHIPLGLDPATAVSLQQSIKKEVSDCLDDLGETHLRLDELSLENSHIHVEVTPLCEQIKNESSSLPISRSLTQRQVQERLYSNQCVLGVVNPIRCRDNLPQLIEMLSTRIAGDKEVLSIFATLRHQIPQITDNEPIEPRLRKYQHSVECAITLLREIEDELAIKSSDSGSPASEKDNQELHQAKPPSLTSSPPPPVLVTQSSASLDRQRFSEGDEVSPKPIKKHRMSSLKSNVIRPNSAVTLESSSKLSQSTQSINKTTANALEESSSVQDIPFATDGHLDQPKLPMAGMKKRFGPLRRSLRSSMRRLSSSTGSVSFKRKKMYRTGSNGGEEVLEDTKKELLEAQETIQSLRKRERELTDRLSEQAQRHLQDSEMFEDILMGASRPSLVIQRYQELYSQERVEAYDAIADTELMDDAIVPEFLLDVLKMACSGAQCNLESLNNGWRRTLSCLPEEENTASFKQLESAVSTYIRKKAPSHDHSGIVKMVNWDLEKKYGNFPFFQLLIRQESLQVYIKECSKLCWDLVVQNPPMLLNYKEVEFLPELHTRFHSADNTSDIIVAYLWPTLIQDRSGTVLYKGVVLT